jgi:hypothetical protein
VGTLATVSGGPPVVSTLLSVLPTMKPTYRLSGDQKGVEAPSVPGRRRHSSASRSRNHNPAPTAASLRPSGDTDALDRVTFSGHGASNRPGEPGAVGWKKKFT